MRLRLLTEAECYARCYGGRSVEAAASSRELRSPTTAPPGRARFVDPLGVQPGAVERAEGLEAA